MYKLNNNYFNFYLKFVINNKYILLNNSNFIYYFDFQKNRINKKYN
jgi:hypothetical protein